MTLVFKSAADTTVASAAVLMSVRKSAAASVRAATRTVTSVAPATSARCATLSATATAAGRCRAAQIDLPTARRDARPREKRVGDANPATAIATANDVTVTSARMVRAICHHRGPRRDTRDATAEQMPLGTAAYARGVLWFVDYVSCSFKPTNGVDALLRQPWSFFFVFGGVLWYVFFGLSRR